MVGPVLSLLVFPREASFLTAGLLAGGGLFAAVRVRHAWTSTAARLSGPGGSPDGASSAPGAVVVGMEITEQRRTEEALRQSESFLREAQAIAHLGHWILDLQTSALTWSHEIYRIFEIDPELFGATYEAFLNAIHPDDRAMVDAAYTKSVAERTQYSVVHRLLMADGRVKYVREQGRTDYSDDGAPLRSIGTVHDISDLHRVEEALRQSEETFRTLAEAAPSLIWIGRGDTTFFVNDAVVALTGYSREELLAPGGFFPRTIHPDDREAVSARGRARVRGEPVPARYELRMVTAGGDVHWLDFSGGVVTYDGAPANLGVAVDITERKRNEEALRDSEERLRAIFDAEPECVKLLDLDGRLIDMNRAGLQMIEAGSIDEVLGATVGDLVLLPYQDAFREVNRRAAAGESGILEFEIEGLKGTRRWLETHVTALRGPGGDPAAILGVTRDITERRAAERRILSALQEKETLLKEVHHRVKNNLAIVVELLEMQRNRQIDEGSRAALLESESRIYAMALVHEMLYQSTDLASIDLRQHVDRLCHQLLQSYGRHGAEIRLNTRVEDMDLPLDRAIPFSLVLNELVSNALKHAFPGGRPGAIDVAVGPAGDGSTFLEVRDDGVGLDPAIDLEASRTLGLRLVGSLARQLGATVEVSSNQGATFRLVFQAERPEVKKA